ncbi:tryptophan-rich sensory protein [Phormidium tenue FACHB-886]|nr:tryptophan-rich sensory protein [Phormidium tenue FACHB-886]
MNASTQPTRPNVVQPIVTLVAILATLGVNIFSNLYPLNGANIGEISNTLFADVLIIPANYAFAIWGLIYLGLIGFGIYQLLPSQRQNPRLRRVGYWLVVACLAQIVWVYLFLSRQFGLSVVAMLWILLPLIGIYERLEIGERRVPRSEKWLAQVPLSLYLGWISVATVVNMASALFASNWSGWGIDPQGWTVIMLGVSVTLAAVVAITRRDATLPLVIVWALVAIAIRQARFPFIAIAAIGLAIILVLFVLFGRWRSTRPTVKGR